MRRRRNPDDVDLYLMGAAGLGLVALAAWKGEEITNAVVDTVTDVVSRGTRLTHAAPGPDGVVPIRPDALRLTAAGVLGYDLVQDAYDLARMIRSEGASAGILRAHVALNDADDLGWTVHGTITYSTNPAANGWFGEQFTSAARAPNGVKSSRRYATTKDPYAGDVEIAQQAMLEHVQGIDPTGGAVKFVDKSSMGGVQAGSGSYADLVERWAAERLQPFNVPGYSDDLVVFRRVG